MNNLYQVMQENEEKNNYRREIQEAINQFDETEEEYFHIRIIAGENPSEGGSIFFRDLREEYPEKNKLYYCFNVEGNSMVLTAYGKLNGERKEVIDRFNANLAAKLGLNKILIEND